MAGSRGNGNLVREPASGLPAGTTNGAVVWNGSAWVSQKIAAANLTDPGTGKVYGSDGAGNAAAVLPPGYEIAYVEVTTAVTAANAAEASATQVVSAGAITFDGTPVLIEGEFPLAQGDVGSGNLNVFLFDGATSLGYLGYVNTTSSAYRPMRVARRITPSAAAHTYSIRATSGTGNGALGGGAGGIGVTLPGFIRIIKV